MYLFFYSKDCSYLISFIEKKNIGQYCVTCNLDVEWKGEHRNRISWARRWLSAVRSPNSFSEEMTDNKHVSEARLSFILCPNLVFNATEHISYSHCLLARKESMLMNPRHLRYAYQNKVLFEKIEKSTRSFLENETWKIMRNKIPQE